MAAFPRIFRLDHFTAQMVSTIFDVIPADQSTIVLLMRPASMLQSGMIACSHGRRRRPVLGQSQQLAVQLNAPSLLDQHLLEDVIDRSVVVPTSSPMPSDTRDIARGVWRCGTHVTEPAHRAARGGPGGSIPDHGERHKASEVRTDGRKADRPRCRRRR